MHPGVQALGQSRGRGASIIGRSLDGSRPSNTTIVLLYVVENGVGTRAPFAPVEVTAWAKEKLGIVLDRRRVHEAIKYLLERGVFEKVSRGLYRVKDAAKALLELRKRLTGSNGNTVRCNRVSTGAGGRGGSCAGRRVRGVVWDGECAVLLRDHMDVERGWRVDPVGLLLRLLRALSFKARLYRWVVGFVRRLLRAMGVSHYLIRRVTREASRVFGEVRRRGRILVGGHGCVEYDKRRGRCERGRFYPLEELMRLVAGDNGRGPWFREFGFDIVLCPSRPGESVNAGEASELVSRLREVIGHSDVYAPAPGTGSRR